MTQYSSILSLAHSLTEHTVECSMFLELSRAWDGDVFLNKTLMLLWGSWEEGVPLAGGEDGMSWGSDMNMWQAEVQGVHSL